MTLEESLWADGHILVKDMTCGLKSKYWEVASHINSPGTHKALKALLNVLNHFVLKTSWRRYSPYSHFTHGDTEVEGGSNSHKIQSL